LTAGKEDEAAAEIIKLADIIEALAKGAAKVDATKVKALEELVTKLKAAVGSGNKAEAAKDVEKVEDQVKEASGKKAEAAKESTKEIIKTEVKAEAVVAPQADKKADAKPKRALRRY